VAALEEPRDERTPDGAGGAREEDVRGGGHGTPTNDPPRV
jgi:hypothetical protein